MSQEATAAAIGGIVAPRAFEEALMRSANRQVMVFRCPTYSKAELMRAYLSRRGISARQDWERVHVEVEGDWDRAGAISASERYGATLESV